MLHATAEAFNFLQVVTSVFSWNLESLNSQFLHLNSSVSMNFWQASSAAPTHSLQLWSLVALSQGPHLYGALGSTNPVNSLNIGLKKIDL